MNFDHVVVWLGYTQITGTSYGMLTNNEDIPWGMRADEVDIPWGGRAPIRWTHNGTCAHIKGTSHIRSLTKEQSSTFSCGLILRRFCTKRKKLSDIDFLQRKFTANAKVQIPSAAKSVTAEEVIVMKMTNREN